MKFRALHINHCAISPGLYYCGYYYFILRVLLSCWNYVSVAYYKIFIFMVEEKI